MKIDKISIDTLVLDPANVRVHPKKNLEAIKGSLARFGQRTPIIVDKNNVVRKGNGTLQAARSLGLKEVFVIRVEDLTEAELTAYAIADNRTGELADWDAGALLAQLDSLKLKTIDLEQLGFAPSDLALFEASLRAPKPGQDEEGGQGKPDEKESPAEFQKIDDDLATEHTCPKCGYQFSGGKVSTGAVGEGPGNDGSIEG